MLLKLSIINRVDTIDTYSTCKLPTKRRLNMTCAVLILLIVSSGAKISFAQESDGAAPPYFLHTVKRRETLGAILQRYYLGPLWGKGNFVDVTNRLNKIKKFGNYLAPGTVVKIPKYLPSDISKKININPTIEKTVAAPQPTAQPINDRPTEVVRFTDKSKWYNSAFFSLGGGLLYFRDTEPGVTTETISQSKWHTRGRLEYEGNYNSKIGFNVVGYGSHTTLQKPASGRFVIRPTFAFGGLTGAHWLPFSTGALDQSTWRFSTLHLGGGFENKYYFRRIGADEVEILGLYTPFAHLRIDLSLLSFSIFKKRTALVWDLGGRFYPQRASNGALKGFFEESGITLSQRLVRGSGWLVEAGVRLTHDHQQTDTAGLNRWSFLGNATLGYSF